jgi:pyruvate,orthophosphate dikinase
MKELLGGKGANLAEMTSIGLPVPPGFTITTETCEKYYKGGKRLPHGLMNEVHRNMARCRRRRGKVFGDATTRCSSPSARAPRSRCPGMMDTVLNLGLNDESVEGLASRPATGASRTTPTAA